MTLVCLPVRDTASWEAARALRLAVFVQEQGVPLAEEFDEQDARAHHVVAWLDGAPVGTGRCFLGADGRGVIGRMAVLPPARGQGVGAAIMRSLLARLVEAGVSTVWLSAQVHAQGFYRRFGFSPVGEPYDEVGILHQAMQRRLLVTESENS